MTFSQARYDGYIDAMRQAETEYWTGAYVMSSEASVWAWVDRQVIEDRRNTERLAAYRTWRAAYIGA